MEKIYCPVHTAKKAAKVLVSTGIATAAIQTIAHFIPAPFNALAVPVLSAIISGLGNWLKHKKGIKTPI